MGSVSSKWPTRFILPLLSTLHRLHLRPQLPPQDVLTDVDSRAKDARRADARKLAASHESGAAARTHRAARIPLRQDTAVVGKAVNVGRVGRRMSRKAKVAVAH